MHTKTIAVTPGTRLCRIDRVTYQDGGKAWRVWTATRGGKHGSFLELSATGSIHSVVVREDEGDQVTKIKGPDYNDEKKGE